MRQVLPGHHVKVSRGFYDHHGVYMGIHEGQPVIAELAKPSDGGVVRFIPWTVFRQGNPVCIVDHADGVPLGQVVQNVWRVRGWRRYDLLNWNCEHFATWCSTHKSRSLQLEGVAAGAALLLGCLMLGKLAA